MPEVCCDKIKTIYKTYLQSEHEAQTAPETERKRRTAAADEMLHSRLIIFSLNKDLSTSLISKILFVQILLILKPESVKNKNQLHFQQIYDT